MLKQEAFAPEKVEELLNRKLRDVQVFDYTRNTWMQREFSGLGGEFSDLDMKKIYEFRHVIEKEPYMKGYKLAAFAISSIPARDLRTWDFCKTGSAFVSGPTIAANLITYNMQSGQYEANPRGWFGQGHSESYICLQYAAERGFMDFVNYISHDAALKNKFLSGYKGR